MTEIAPRIVKIKNVLHISPTLGRYFTYFASVAVLQGASTPETSKYHSIDIGYPALYPALDNAGAATKIKGGWGAREIPKAQQDHN